MHSSEGRRGRTDEVPFLHITVLNRHQFCISYSAISSPQKVFRRSTVFFPDTVDANPSRAIITVGNLFKIALIETVFPHLCLERLMSGENRT